MALAELSVVNGDGTLETRAQSLVQRLMAEARARPQAPVLRYVREDGAEPQTLIAADWDGQARRVAAWLRERGAVGDRVLLAHGPGLGFMTGFFGCLYAGMVAVPAYPPRRTRHGVRLESVLADCGAQLALADSVGAAALRRVAETGGLWAGLQVLDQDGPAFQALPSLLQPHSAAESEVAYLQYTSGSTASPKGVMVTHRALLHNLELMRQAFQGSPAMVMVSWLPLFHDMGLVLGALLPLYCEGHCVLMAPNEFVQRPRLWLEALSRYGGTHAAAPDFAYRLCAEKLGPEDLQGLDLHAWTVAVNGAEPVRSATLRAFTQRFGPVGFRPETFHPSYGMAEATLYISHDRWDGGSEDPISCGRALGQQLLVVDPETRRLCPAGQTGEIWVQGPSICAGYWQRPEQSEDAFRAETADGRKGFLRTGDLGRLHDGTIRIQGRLKDLIILRGVNHHPEDLEESSRRATGSGAGVAAAFAVEGADGEALVLVQELSKARRQEAPAVAQALAQALAQGHGVTPQQVLIVGHGQVPRTSSGKVQRRASKQDWADGSLRYWHRWSQPTGAVVGGDAAVEAAAPLDSLRRAEALALAELETRRAQGAPKDLDPGVARALPVAGVHAGMPNEDRSLGIPAKKIEWRERAHPALASLWTAQQQSPASGAYHIAWSLLLGAPLDLPRLRADLQRLVRAQPVLASAFHLDEGGALWMLAEPLAVNVERPFEGSTLSHAQARAWLQAWNAQPMDSGQAPLWRCCSLDLDDGRSLVAFCFHHLIFDQRSWEAFHALLEEPQLRAAEGEGFKLPEREALLRGREHWRATLSQARLKPLLARPSGQGALEEALLDAPLVEALLKAARRHRVTPFVAMAAAWGDALARLSGAPEALFAVPMTLRAQPLSDLRIGYQVQPMPLLLGRLGEDPAIALAKAQLALRDAAQQRALTLGEALRCGGLPAPEAFLVYQGGMTAQPRFQGSPCDLEAIPNQGLKASLALEVSGESEWKLSLAYDAGLGVERARALLSAFEQGLRWLSGEEARRQGRPALIRSERLLPGSSRSVVDALHARVSADADATALRWSDGSLSYGELAERVRAVARALDQAGLRPGQRVAVLAKAGPDWVAALLGCFEAGAVYVPVDPAYPPDRQRGMLAAAPCDFALIEGPIPDAFKGSLTLDLNDALHARPPYLRQPGRPAPGDPAYVIFTSGSSGRPKGVQVSHGALMNHAQGYAQRLGLGAGDRCLQFVSVSFDPSLEELLPALLSGACVVLGQRQAAPSVAEMEALLRAQQVSVLHLPAAYWHAWMAAGGQEALRRLPDLRAVVTGGEAPDPHWVRALLEAGAGRIRYYNAYGPTEACISVSLHECAQALEVPAHLPLGRPLPGMSLAVVDDDGALVSDDAEGELWIAGPQLADGHWIDAQMQQSAFPQARLQGSEEPRWYRSGDRVRWVAGQGLVHLGRMDRQVKILGHRLEPGEIEQILLEAPGVAQAAVEPQAGPQGPELWAWVVAEPGAGLDPAGLKAHVQARLPKAIGLRRLSVLPALPLTPNGKVDRRALVAGADIQAPLATQAVAPGEAGVLERFCQAWSTCLGVEGLGPDADFFEHGGSSLTAVRLAAELGRLCDRDLSVDLLMKVGTPRGLHHALFGGSAQAQVLRPLAGSGSAAWVLFPPVSGRLDCYRGLAARLGASARVVGVDLAAIDTAGAERWGAWVRRCCEQILRELPEGPLALGGWSMGGLLAADVARALRAQGRAVERLALIDSLVPDPVESALVLDDPGALDPVFDRDLTGLGTENGGGEATAPWRQRFREHAEALASYQPRSIDVPVTLAVSEKSARERPRSSWMAWSLLASEGLTTVLLPGDHYALLSGSAGERLADRMNKDAWKRVQAPDRELQALGGRS